jgi:uncharacterized protein (TIGR02996 family)
LLIQGKIVMDLSSEERALLLGIVAQWDDDVPRLVYADWLEEQDRWPRAEFIRLQCHLARALRDSEQVQVRSRLIDNLQDHINTYGTEACYVELPENSWVHNDEYLRGFPNRIMSHTSDAEDPKLLAYPLVEMPSHRLRFYFYDSDELLGLFQSPSLKYCHGLELRRGDTDEDLSLHFRLADTILMLYASIPETVKLVSLYPWIDSYGERTLFERLATPLPYILELSGPADDCRLNEEAYKAQYGDRVRFRYI